MIAIIPAILERDFDEVEKKLQSLHELFSWVQIDVTDGVLTEGKTFELELLTTTGRLYDHLLYDIHLMVKEPIKWIKKAVFVNASRIIGHVELMTDREEFVQSVKERGLEAGLAFDIGTPIDAHIPQETDIILLMSRKAGFGSFPLEEQIYERIKELAKIRTDNGFTYRIGIDGGINKENIGLLHKAGAEIFYCTSAIFNGNIEVNLSNLKKYADQR